MINHNYSKLIIEYFNFIKINYNHNGNYVHFTNYKRVSGSNFIPICYRQIPIIIVVVHIVVHSTQ